MMQDFERIPPSSNEAEQAALGAMLLEREAIMRAEELLRPEDFYREAHRTIYTGILALYQKREPVDLITLHNWLRDNGKSDDVGGALYLTTLMNQVPTAAGIAYYAGTVRECSIRRRLIKQADETMADAYRMDTELDDVLTRAGQRFTRPAEKSATVKSIGEYAEDAYREYYHAAESKTMQGFRTGWKSINGVLRPFRPGQLIAISADTGIGKSAWALNLAVDLAEQKRRGIIFSLEMPGMDVSLRAVLEKMTFTQDDLDNIHAHEDSDAVLIAFHEAKVRLAGLPLRIDEEAGNRIDMIERRIQAEIREFGQLTFAVVDYIGLIPLSGSDKKRYEELGALSTRLKQIAERYKLTVFALCQLGTKKMAARHCRRPQLEDVYESGRIPQDCDLFAALYRPGQYGEAELKKAGYDPKCPLHWFISEFIGLKSRNGVAAGKRPFTCQYFNQDHVSFRDLSDAEWHEVKGGRNG